MTDVISEKKKVGYHHTVLEKVLSGSEQKHMWGAHECRKGLTVIHTHASTDKQSPLV